MDLTQIVLGIAIVTPVINVAVIYGSLKTGMNGTKKDIKEIKETVKTLPCLNHEQRIAFIEGSQTKRSTKRK